MNDIQSYIYILIYQKSVFTNNVANTISKAEYRLHSL